MKMIWKLIMLLLIHVSTSIWVPLPEVEKMGVKEETEVKRVGSSIRVPFLLGNNMYKMEYVPQGKSACSVEADSFVYWALANSPPIFQHLPSTVLYLPRDQAFLLADVYGQIAIYSIDQHSLMAPIFPPLQLTNSTSPHQPVLLQSKQDSLAYYFSQAGHFLLEWKGNTHLKVQQFELKGIQEQIVGGFSLNQSLILCTMYSGFYFYTIDSTTNLPTLISAKNTVNTKQHPVSICFSDSNHLLYVLSSGSTIHVYIIKEKSTLQAYDTIDLANITFQWGKQKSQMRHIRLEISRIKEESSQLFVLFWHNKRTVIAELNYVWEKREFIFVRYYKLGFKIQSLSVFQKVIIVHGKGKIGMFPYGIHPTLIQTPINGFLSPTSFQFVFPISPSLFIGFGVNWELNSIYLPSKSYLVCDFDQPWAAKQIILKANFTQGNLGQFIQYQKRILFRDVEISSSSGLSPSLCILFFLLTYLMGSALYLLFLHRRKEIQILKIHLVQEEKKFISSVINFPASPISIS